MSGRDLVRRLRAIELVCMDCDGVLTDGSICIGPDGREWKVFHAHDGTGIKYLHRAGLKTAIISGRTAPALLRRARELGVPYVFQGVKVKLDGLTRLVRRSGIPPERICFVGDDLPDIPVLRAVGLGVAVADARPEVRRVAHWITPSPGGRGAIRDVAERILRAQRRWGAILERYFPRDALESGGRK